jgi:hypothetical protein
VRRRKEEEKRKKRGCFPLAQTRPERDIQRRERELELEEKNQRNRESVLLPNQNKKEKEERKKERGVPWWPGHRRWAMVVFPATWQQTGPQLGCAGPYGKNDHQNFYYFFIICF